jgi:phage-related protein
MRNPICADVPKVGQLGLVGADDDPKPRLGLRFYRTAAGTAPVRDWLRSLAAPVRQRIGKDLYKVQLGGPTIGKPLVDGLGDGLYEVRSSHDKNEYRTLFYVERGTIVAVQSTMVIVHGLHKKTRKTPSEDLALARKRMKEGT